MDKFQDSTAFSCELRIIRARNVEFNSTGSLFVRCYMSAGNNKRVRFESREVSSSNMVWNQSFSLNCFGTKESMSNMLFEGTVIFELRQRSGISFFGRTGKSQLLGKAEVPWKTVYESSTLDIEKWIVMKPKKSLLDGVKPPAVEVGMKVTGAQAILKHAKNGGAKECGRGCRSLVESELFALDAALEFSCY
ncbi:Transmembrane gamma-carboxyglutamic acid protein like [Heracleum sosnowskyi]|uniref:Transmembrane gamma-carboxyglutamic acid protein like n=1 Tax=Heracleum sosnowskyi TaxID=360622 RepID=A0AAD8MGB7_9APIA|nr:Transmembrane gamma-carboxyglutamic acid protein like [Heracleum sosnowskyi]